MAERVVRQGNIRGDALQLYLSVKAKASQPGRLVKRKHSSKS